MSRPDLTSNTEHQAGISAQRDAWDEREVDWDVPSDLPPPPHECTSANPDRCLRCALDAVVAKQRAAREADPLWAEHVAEQNAEHWQEGA